MKLNVLGTEYEIIKASYQDDTAFSMKHLSGYCDGFSKIIVYCDLDTVDGWSDDLETTRRASEKETLRHEIIHAFLTESGLNACAHETESWADDEEIIEWFAIQGTKIYKAWQEVDAI